MPSKSKESEKYFSPFRAPAATLYTNRVVAGIDRHLSNRELSFHICTSSDVPVHLHENYYEIFIVTNGKLTHYFDGAPTVMKTGDAFFLYPGQHHKLSTYKTYTSRHINLTCSAEMALTLFAHPDGTVQKPAQQSLHLRDTELKIAQAFQESIFLSSDEAYQTATIGVLMAYVARLFLLRGTSSTSEQLPNWLSTFVDQLNNLDFSVPFSLPELYTMSGKPQSTLSRQFKKYMGQTLISYLTDLKLTRAGNLLKSSTFPLTEVAQTCGFDSYPHFSRLFKNKFGISPQQYRCTHSFYTFPKNTDNKYSDALSAPDTAEI